MAAVTYVWPSKMGAFSLYLRTLMRMLNNGESSLVRERLNILCGMEMASGLNSSIIKLRIVQ